MEFMGNHKRSISERSLIAGNKIERKDSEDEAKSEDYVPTIRAKKHPSGKEGDEIIRLVADGSPLFHPKEEGKGKEKLKDEFDVEQHDERTLKGLDLLISGERKAEMKPDGLLSKSIFSANQLGTTFSLDVSIVLPCSEWVIEQGE